MTDCQAIEEMEDESYEIRQTSPAELEEMDSSQAPTTYQAVKQLEINDLVTEIRQSSPNLEKALGDLKAAWNEILVQKLVDAQLDPTKGKLKELVDKQMEPTSNKIDNLLGVLVHDVTSVARLENRVTFEFDPKSMISIRKWIYLGDLIFQIGLYTSPVDLYVICFKMWKVRSCKVRVDVTIKNHAGRPDCVRCFSKILNEPYPSLKKHDLNNLSNEAIDNQIKALQNDLKALDNELKKLKDDSKKPNIKCPADTLKILNLIEKSEYEDESLGFLKDGNLAIEVVVYTDDQLVNNQPPPDSLTAAPFVLRAESFARSEDKLLFELKPTKEKLRFKCRKAMFLRGLIFDVMLFSSPIDLTIIGHHIPTDKSCKARIEVTVKNQAGQRDGVRRLNKVFWDSDKMLYLRNLIAEEEYADESSGFLKDGILLVEVAIQIDEPK